MAVLLAFVMNPKNWQMIGAAALLALLVVQSARLHHAKADLVTARAALVDPVSHRTWKDVAGSAIAGRDAALVSLGRQKAAVTAMQEVSDRKMAELTAGLDAALRTHAAAERTGSALLAARLSGADRCAKASDAFAKVSEALQ